PADRNENPESALAEEIEKARELLKNLRKMQFELREATERTRDALDGQVRRLEKQLAVATEKAHRSEADRVLDRRLGVQLEVIAANQLAELKGKIQLNGGLRVVQLHPQGTAAQAGIQRGDILVGLHQWETQSLENVLFVLNRSDLDSISPLRFYV